jgi:hypothetical protein
MSLYIASRRRRGMLLLMVMLMLALFMSIGAMLLTIAARARAAARANMFSSQQTAGSDPVFRDALDQALLAALRGTATGTNGSVFFTTPSEENLLADKYGVSLNATCSITSSTNLPVITLSLSPVSDDEVLSGRIVTFNPLPTVGDVASFRILGALSSGSTAVCFVANMPSMRSRRLPPPGVPFPAVINGREFTPAGSGSTPESYDGFDDLNRFLAQPVVSGGQVASFVRSSFIGHTGSFPPIVDNDNDGIADGIWFPTAPSDVDRKVLPDMPSPLGGTRRFQVSYLILDLDGRLNVNACGIARPTGGSYTGSQNGLVGLGYGPADVDISLLFPPTLPPASGLSPFLSSGTGAWSPLVVNGVPSVSGSAPSPTQRRPPPLLGTIHGRYGPDGRPGAGSINDAGGYYTALGGTNYSLTVTGTNTIADLQGRLKLYMTGSASNPKQTFFSSAAYSAAVDALDDPYELRLDEDSARLGAPRRPSPSTAGTNDDSPYTLGELERILRPNDPDTPQLPQRLAAGIETYAQASRMWITTDSWDSPSVSGTAGKRVIDYLEDLPAMSSAVWSGSSNSVSADTAAGLKMNINRPVLSGTSPNALADQQEYCKSLYTLARALGVAAAPAAQWAANALDFRDNDDGNSILTKFDYDTNPSNGWQASEFAAQPVWGMERPELIFESSTHNSSTGNVDVTLRRPACEVELVASGSTVQLETIAPSLGTPPYTLFFRASPPIWRLSVDPGGATHAIADDSSLAPGSTKIISTPFAGGSSSRVYLERLANPATAFNATTNPYVKVDEIAVSPVPGNTTNPPLPIPSRFHWPNRPFISHAELLLVSGTYASRNPLLSSVASTTPGILDVTHVPSRFAGNAATISGSLSNLSLVGLDRFSVDQFSKWREPGKVNVNTIVSSTNAAIDTDDVVWTTLIGGTTPTNPYVAVSGSGATPAASIGVLISGSSFSNQSFGDLRDTNPLIKAGRSIRLANTATVRSHVFAVWITVKITDDSTTPPTEGTKRMFAIIDRSIPVGYSPNQDLNVRDTIKLKRYLD